MFHRKLLLPPIVHSPTHPDSVHSDWRLTKHYLLTYLITYLLHIFIICLWNHQSNVEVDFFMKHRVLYNIIYIIYTNCRLTELLRSKLCYCISGDDIHQQIQRALKLTNRLPSTTRNKRQNYWIKERKRELISITHLPENSPIICEGNWYTSIIVTSSLQYI